ncbi:phage BR0599 family protein [Pseudomonas sp. F1_0610]|uniref:phage BR0599 family protein n=1 Tax=Pseudomonas sp. F1_0610 TaxID=3114284 RepID=UPI0039C0E467
MSFNQIEKSLADAQPIRLYEFRRDVLRFTYNSSDRDITHNNQIFKSLVGGISDSGIKQTGQGTADALKITAPASLEVAQLYRGAAPSSPIFITIYMRHFGIDDFVVIYAGEVRNVGWPKPESCVITCAQLSERMDMTGLRLCWERSCPHALYSVACGVNRDHYRVQSSIQNMDGAMLENGAFAGYQAGYFTGGYVEWMLAGGSYERRGIQQHQQSKLFLLGGTTGLALGAEIRVYPGCKQTTSGCKSFNNLDNFGGIPHLAGESPYGQNIF